MKKKAILLSLVVLFAVSCTESGLESQVPNVTSTPCKQEVLKSSGLLGKVDVEFTEKGVQITHYNFEVPCDFTTVNVTHSLVNGVLNITQQGSPNQANCVCHSDVSYTIEGISQSEVNVIFINSEQVYCHNDNNQSNCDKDVIISQTEFQNAPNDLYEILDVEIIEGCLKIKFRASGCDGNNWIVNLIDAEIVAESLPEQRTLRLSLENNEDCQAVIEKEISFNIENLQINGSRRVSLNVSGNEILYEY